MLGTVVKLFFGTDSVIPKTYKLENGLRLLELFDNIHVISFGLRTLYINWANFDRYNYYGCATGKSAFDTFIARGFQKKL